jgi:hypothetical protein
MTKVIDAAFLFRNRQLDSLREGRKGEINDSYVTCDAYQAPPGMYRVIAFNDRTGRVVRTKDYDSPKAALAVAKSLNEIVLENSRPMEILDDYATRFWVTDEDRNTVK